MLYEIRSMEKIAGKTYRKSFITDHFEFANTKRNGDCVRFKVEGKKSAQYVMTSRHLFHEDFETVIAEATTGRVIYRFN